MSDTRSPIWVPPGLAGSGLSGSPSGERYWRSSRIWPPPRSTSAHSNEERRVVVDLLEVGDVDLRFLLEELERRVDDVAPHPLLVQVQRPVGERQPAGLLLGAPVER